MVQEQLPATPAQLLPKFLKHNVYILSYAYEPARPAVAGDRSRRGARPMRTPADGAAPVAPHRPCHTVTAIGAPGLAGGRTIAAMTDGTRLSA